MFRITSTKTTHFIIIAFIAICSSIALCNLPSLVNLQDIEGLPSKIATNLGVRHVYRSRAIFADRIARRRAASRELVATGLSRFRQERPIIMRERIAVRVPGLKGKKTLIAKTVVTVPYQNLILNIVNPNKAAIPGLHLSAIVHVANAPDVKLEGLVTGSDGTLKLPKLGPLPVRVDLTVADETNNSASAHPADLAAAKDPEWKFPDTDTVSVAVDNPEGDKIATVQNLPYREASLAPVVSSRRAVIWQFHQMEPIIVERTIADVDIAAPAGALVACAALGETSLTIPATGHLTVHIPTSMLEAGPVPMRVATELPGGEAEAVVSDYSADPYQTNTVTPKLTLVRLYHINLPTGVGVMVPSRDVKEALGNAVVTNQDDGSQRWMYPSHGLAFSVRPYPDHQIADAIVERVRITAPAGGDIAGITIGSSADQVAAAFGTPQSTQQNIFGPGTIQHYLDDGVQVCIAESQVKWIELARRTTLLSEGTTAFVARPQANLYVESYKGDPFATITDENSLTAYLNRLPSIKVVDSP